MKAALKQWGNDLAVCIPQEVLEQGNFQKDDVFEITVRSDEIILKRIISGRQNKLDSMLERITPDNIHDRMDFGVPAGKELL